MLNNIVLAAVAWGVNLRGSVREFLRREDGQDLMEYAVLVGAIAIVAAGALFLIGPDVFDDFAVAIEDCIALDPDNCGVL